MDTLSLKEKKRVRLSLLDSANTLKQMASDRDAKRNEELRAEAKELEQLAERFK